MNVGNEARTGTAEAEKPIRTVPSPAATTVPAPAGGPEAPPLTGRVAYVFGGALPARYVAWVSRDLTGPGWRRRQALRPVLMMLPFAVIFALLPGPVGVRALLVAFLLVAAGGLGLGMSGHFRNRRLVQHGFPPVIKLNVEDVEDVEDVEPERPAGLAPARARIDATPATREPSQPDSTGTSGSGSGADPDDPDGINA
ncbi:MULTISPECIES: DUF5313 family protein [Pseudofrankia]|uniref:DUF5313 family protein n=1 Tax=Pseudofrankia TaxID=2994363 RepID=UPI000234B7FF|nr:MULTISPECIES: DUF5313 family protein [Pseudofrankia]